MQRQPFHKSESAWLRSFALDHLKVLVVCRGPVRREAFDCFAQMGVREYGMLLSEKDSVVYPHCLAPELRAFPFPQNIHRVPDYAGATQEEKHARIAEIVTIAADNNYTHIFAGYGFMAEDADFVAAIEEEGVGFMGPSAAVIRRAGAKDEAKKLARQLGNQVIPGVDDISARALIRKCGGQKELQALAKREELTDAWQWNNDSSALENATQLLFAGYAAARELVSIAELQHEAEQVCAEMWQQHKGRGIRFKHVSGGGGKGQRVVYNAEQIPAAVMDLLAESKATAAGSNRNFLVELNLEQTRHNEIQLIGNGQWCISLGGRDCSVQMHEQKLLEVSLTKEMLEAEAARATGAAQKTLRGDMQTLANMEREGALFGEATGLNSVSTFECIVEGFDHFFMEMNTRIQVEHGVTELAYALRFTNPQNPEEHFDVLQLIEAMALLAVHGEKLPKPARVQRAPSGLEARINATNAALQPHAGGVIRGWSQPLPGEIRFDQGIGARNPDTGAFIWYNLAGAYDSNIALLLCEGETRRANYKNMAEILRRMELRGDDLQTNRELHYGLVQWFLGRGVMARPTTRFMGAYLAGVGALQKLANDVSLEVAVGAIQSALPNAAARETFAAKQTLLQRPLQRMLNNPHVLGGFLGRYNDVLWRRNKGRVELLQNPVHFLQRLYHFLNLEAREGKPPAEQIWNHDAALLQNALHFYAQICARAGLPAEAGINELDALFAGAPPAFCGGDARLWAQCQAAHRGHQTGLELLRLLPELGARSGFLDIKVDSQLRPQFPPQFADAEQAAAAIRALAPPPPAAGDEIVTPMGGTFYASEAPHLPPLIKVGAHFEAGQPLFIIEVMKMFNKVAAPCAGTVTENLMEGKDGAVVRKGQRIFKMEPDERAEAEAPEAAAARARKTTLQLLG